MLGSSCVCLGGCDILGPAGAISIALKSSFVSIYSCYVPNLQSRLFYKKKNTICSTKDIGRESAFLKFALTVVLVLSVCPSYGLCYGWVGNWNGWQQILR